MYVFVYGTLRKSYPGGMARYLMENATFIAEGVVENADMYYVGGYPGVVRGSGKIIGDIFEIPDNDVIEKLDSYEGHPSLFERTPVKASSPETGQIEAFIYYYKGNVDKRRDIPDGDFLKFIKNPDLSAKLAAGSNS